MEDKKQPVQVANLRYEGTAITLPALPRNMPIPDAIKSLQMAQEYAETEVTVVEFIDSFVWDAAVALDKAIKRTYTIAVQRKVPGNRFTPDRPPATIGVDVGNGEIRQVPWGRTFLPNVDGYLDVGMELKDGRVILVLSATVKRMFEDEIRKLAMLTREILTKESIYKGKAFRMKFTDPDDNYLNIVPKWIDVSRADESMLVLAPEVEDMVRTNLFAPLEIPERLMEDGIPFKSGVLLAGHYGTGKTMSALIAAKKAVMTGITFLQVEDPEEFARAVEFVRPYQPAVVFCEDIDRVMNGPRTKEIDSILNTVDGINSKSNEIMVVLTTNQEDSIYPGMIRPGRIDTVIEFLRPDAPTIKRLLRMYAGDTLDPKADLSEAAKLLEGQIPAIVQQAVVRSRKSARRRNPLAKKVMISGDALTESARTMQRQIELLERKPKKEPGVLLQMGQEIGTEIAKAINLLTLVSDAASTNKAEMDGRTVAVRKNGSWQYVSKENMPKLPQELLDGLR